MCSRPAARLRPRPSASPQWEQNRAPSGFSCPQRGAVDARHVVVQPLVRWQWARAGNHVRAARLSASALVRSPTLPAKRAPGPCATHSAGRATAAASASRGWPGLRAVSGLAARHALPGELCGGIVATPPPHQAKPPAHPQLLADELEFSHVQAIRAGSLGRPGAQTPACSTTAAHSSSSAWAASASAPSAHRCVTASAGSGSTRTQSAVGLDHPHAVGGVDLPAARGLHHRAHDAALWPPTGSASSA